MPNGFARAEIGILSQSASQLVSLANIDNFGAIHPIGDQGLEGNCRVLAFEPAAATLLREAHRSVGGIADDIYATCSWTGTSPDGGQGHPAFKSAVF